MEKGQETPATDRLFTVKKFSNGGKSWRIRGKGIELATLGLQGWPLGLIV